MARLRFPGRPGCRFDRMGVRYGADDAKNVKDPTLVLVASIHRGLRLFRELFGESDEEEDFEGFTEKDVQKSERKLKAMLAQCEDSPEKVVPSLKPATLTSSDRGRGVRKSYTELLKHGIVKPSKSSSMKQARDETQKSLKIKFKIKKEKSGTVSSAQVSRKSLDKKSVKFDLTPKGQGKRKSAEKGVKRTVDVKQKKGKKFPDTADEETPQYAKKKVKERDKLSSKGVKGQQNLAKQLLQKARKGQQTVKAQGKVKSPVTSPKSPKGPAYPRKQFVLPTQSSRSSRVIIPNKRFLEQDDFNQIMNKRIRVEENMLSPKTDLFTTATTSPRARVPERSKVKSEQLKSPQLTCLSPGPALPPLPPGYLFDPMEAGQTALSLYDQPLIVEGKRARKPSLKVRIKLTDERIQAFQVKSFEKKLEARKTIEAEKAAGGCELKKVHLTPSKLAGAVTSPSKLPTSPIFAPPKFGVCGQSALSERQRLEALEKEALATRRKGHNILRKAKLQLSRSALNRSKADFARTLKKEIKMEAKLEKMRLKQGSAVGGFSKLSGYSTFAGVAKNYMDAKDDRGGAGGRATELGLSDSTQEGVVCVVCKDSNLPPLRRRNYYGVPCCDSCRRFYRVHMKRVKEKDFSCNGMCNTDIRRCVFCRYVRCQEVFPAEDKLKPLKESPTKKFVQEESAEDTEGLMSPPRTVPGTGQTVVESEECVSAAGPTTSSPESVASSPASEGRGPRIKHVCRKAAVVLGKPVAKFPQTSPQSSQEITLSALPRGEKVKLWKKEEETKAGLSDDERTLDEIIQQSEDNVCTVKRSPHKSPAFGRLIPGSRGRITVRRRKLRCKKCPGCLATDCGICIYCQDKPKFGGRGVMKQACLDRKCQFPRYSRAATAAFIKPKDPPPDSESCDQGCDAPMEMSEPCDPSQNATGCSNINPNNKNGNATSTSMNLIRRMVLQSQGNACPEGGVKHPGDLDPAIRTPANISRQLLPHFSGGLSRENLSQKSGRLSPLVPPYRSGDLSKKLGLGVLSPKKMPKGKDRNLTILRSEQCVLQPLPSTMKHWSGFGSQSGYRIKAEFKENYDVDKAWLSGVPLTMSGPLCVRTICYLCGSAGKYDFVFCNVCCEPFHEFCLEEDERPKEDNCENWCCHRCQFCHVCGEQHNLLCCDKCQNTYHPECLGPNYPTKPSKKKKIWVCTKCVRCKSCGSTTPGNAGHATWTYDFQLCYECGKLMDKGNFCPMCHKCYSDDDWESKMVQCVTCESWVHAKCEGLNDELYERVSFLPEDVHYICKMCSPGDRPRHWELVLRDDLQAGIKSVFYTLLNAKCAQHLLHINVKEEPVQKEELLEGGNGSVGTAVRECNKEQSSTEGVGDCDRTANDENKVSEKLAESKSELEESNDPTAEKAGSISCSTEPTSVTMETDTIDVTALTDLKCDSDSSDRARGEETGLKEGRGILSGDGARVGLGGEAHCDDSVSGKPVPWSAERSGDHEGRECDVPMEVDQPSPADGTASEIEGGSDFLGRASENESVGGSDILGTASVNDSKGGSMTDRTDFINESVGGCVIDGTASRKESAGGSNDDVIATQNELKADTQGSITDLKDEVDGGQPSGQVGDPQQVCSDPVLDQSQSVERLEPCLSPDKEDQSASEKSKSIVQSEVISITDNDDTHMETEEGSILNNTDQSHSIIQDCKVESSQSDVSLHVKSGPSEDVGKVEVKTEERLSETTASIDKNNTVDLKCETPPKDNAKCETSRTEDTKCETSQNEDTKCEMSQTDGTKCEMSQTDDKKCETSQTEDTKCETSQTDDTKCETPQTDDTKCETSQTDNTKCETSQTDDTKCETKKDDVKCDTPKDNNLSETKCETPEKLSPITDVSLLTPKKAGSLTSAHVRFNDKGGMFRQATPGRDYPPDFNAVKSKLACDKYNSVEEFSEDMAHIISQALNDPVDQRIVRKKNNNSVRSMFAKQMERCFPWFNIKTCKLWDQQQNLPGGMLPDAVIPPSEDHTYAQWLERQDLPKSPQPSPFKKLHSTPIRKALPIAVDEDAEKVLSCDLEDAGEDMRRCILCWHYGDADPNDAGRLLYSGQDDWIHINCALWSAEAYEEELDGSLQYVHAAVSRGKLLKCDHCNRSGATVGCNMRGCPANYHFMCARHSYCVFQEDKKVFCSLHHDKVDGELVAKDRFAVNRRVLVNMEGVKWAKKTWAKGLDPAVINVLIGSCTVESLGRLTISSDYRDCLAPAEFSSSRVFWSTRDARRRCVYTCRIVEVKPDSPKSVKVVLKDVTIIHDESHPQYVPLSTLDIPGVNLFPDTESPNNNNNNNNSFKSDIIDLSGDSYELDGSVTYQSTSFQGRGLNASCNVSSSFASVTDSQSDKLSSSWPLVKKKTIKPDLSLLSPNTLKLLNIKDPEKYKKAPVSEKAVVKQAPPSVVNENNFSGFLTKIADRLNQAAARNISRKDGEKTPPPGAVRGRSRSSSAERTLSSRSNSVERFVPSPLSHGRSKSVERFVKSPLPCSRSRSNSTEREYFVACSAVVPPEGSTEHFNDMGTAPTRDSDVDGNATFSTVSAEESMDQSGIDSSLEPIGEEGDLNTENIRETVIVLPDDCGELTEEQVIAIAQAALQQQQEGEEQEEEEAKYEQQDQLLEHPEENERLEESNFVKYGDASEIQQLMETNKGQEIAEHQGETITDNSSELKETIADPSGQINRSDSGATKETTMEDSVEVTKTDSLGEEITADNSGDVRETTPDSQGEGTTDQSVQEREIINEPQGETVKNHSVEIQETTSGHSRDVRETTVEYPREITGVLSGGIGEKDPQGETTLEDEDCEAMETDTVAETETPVQTSTAGKETGDKGEVIPLDLTGDSSNEIEAANDVDLDDVILIDINKEKQDSQEKATSGQELERNDGMYLCHSTGQLQGSLNVESKSDKRLSGSVCNEDLIESVSNKCLGELVPGEDLTESVSNEGSTESGSDKGLTKVRNVGPMEKRDQAHTDAENVNLNDRCSSTQDQRQAEDESLVDQTRQVPDNVKDSHSEMTDTTADAEETMLTNQQAADSDSLNRYRRLLEEANTKESRDDSVKESDKDVGVTAIDLTGDDCDDDLRDGTNKPGIEEEKSDETEFTIPYIPQITGKDEEEDLDSQKIVRTEPLHFLRPIEEEPVKPQRKKKSPTLKPKPGKRGKKDVPQGRSRSKSSEETANEAKEDTTSRVDYESPEPDMISSTIHLNIVTKTGSDNDGLPSSVETDMTRMGDNSPSADEQTVMDGDETTENDLSQKHRQMDNKRSAEIMEPIYNARNELIGHQVIVAGDSNSPSDLATLDTDRRTSPTTDLWNMVVGELVGENPEKFQPINTDVSQSVEARFLRDTVSVDEFNHGDRDGVNLSPSKNLNDISADDCDPSSDRGDNSAKNQGEGQLSGTTEDDKLSSRSETQYASVKTVQDEVNTEKLTAEIVTENVKDNDEACVTDDQLPFKPPVNDQNLDKSLVNGSPVNKTPVKVHTEEEKRLEKEKTEILKGLGLARTPTGNEETSSPDINSKSSPLKKYPLRHRRSNSGHSDESPVVKGEIDWWSDQKLPMHMEIAQKIKAESLSKSIPGAKGPFKCPTCKRLYRTRESFKTHVKSCDFEVSTSDEEEEEEEEEEGEKDGRRRYSVREHTVEARKAMAGEMRARVALQNRETSPNKKRGRPKRSLNEDYKDFSSSSNHISSPMTDDGTPPVKRGRGRPRMSPEVVLLDCQYIGKSMSQKNKTDLVTARYLQDGTTNTPETGGSKGRRGRPPKLKSPDRGKSPVDRDTKEKVAPFVQGRGLGKTGQEGVRKRGRPSLKGLKTEPVEADVEKKSIRSPLKSLTPTKMDIVRKRGRPSLKLSPKKVFAEEEFVPRKRERLSGGGLKSPLLRSPVRSLVGSPRGRGRPPKPISSSVKVECQEEMLIRHNTVKEHGFPNEKAEQQAVNTHRGEASPTRRRGRPSKISKSPKNIENDQKATKERLSIFEIFGPVEESVGNVSVSVTSPEEKTNADATGDATESVTSPEIKRKRGRPPKNKEKQGREPIKQDENNKLNRRSRSSLESLETSKESPEVKGRKSDLKVKDGLYTESGRPSRRTASLALQKFEDSLGTDSDDTVDNGDYDQDEEVDLATGSEDVKGDNSDETDTQKNIKEKIGSDAISNTRRKQHFVARKESREDSEEIKGDNSQANSANLVTGKQVTKMSGRTLQMEEVGDSESHKEGCSISSAIVIDSENEEEPTKEPTKVQYKQAKQQITEQETEEQNVSKERPSLSFCKDGKTSAVSESGPSSTVNAMESEPNDAIMKVGSAEKDDDKKREALSQSNIRTKTATVPQAEWYGNKTSVTMIGAGFSKGRYDLSRQSSENLTSASTGSGSRGVKLTSSFGVQTKAEEDDQPLGQGISNSLSNTSSNIRIQIQQPPHGSSSAGIGDNMVHPTTPVSIRDLLQQKIAISPVEKAGYQMLQIQRPQCADTLKEDIRSILPILPANILEQLRDPIQRYGAVKMIQSLIKIKSTSDSAKLILQQSTAAMETRNVPDTSPITKFTLPSNISTREAIQNYIKSHISQHNKESATVEPPQQQTNMAVTSQHVAPEAMSGPSYHMVSPGVISDPRLLSPAALSTGFQVMTPSHNSLAGAMVQVPSNLPYQLSPPQPLPQLSPRIPIATHSATQLPQLSPRTQVHTQASRASVTQYLGDMSSIQHLQNLQSSQLPPFNIASSSVSISHPPLTPSFNIAASPQPVLGLTSTPTPIGQRAVMMGPPMGAYNIPQVSGLRPQEVFTSLPGTVMMPQQAAMASQQIYNNSPQMASNRLADPFLTGSAVGNSGSPQLSCAAGEEVVKKNTNTLVRIFVDGKPVAVTTDPSVLNNREQLLSRLGSTNLQAGTYSITVSTHKMTMSTNTLTMAGQSSTPSPSTLGPRTSDSRVLQSLLKAAPGSGLGAAVFPHVMTSTAATNTNIMSTGQLSPVSNSNILYQQEQVIKKLLGKKDSTPVSGLHSYVKNTDRRVRKPMIKPNIIHKKRLTGTSSLSKKMLVTMEKNGVIQGALAKALMRKLVKNNIEVSPKKKIVFRGLHATGKAAPTEGSEAVHDISPVTQAKPCKRPPAAIKIRKVTPTLKVNNIKRSIRRRKTPLKARNVAQPHVTGVMSHPILHAQKELLTLPQPAVEEEVVDTPYSKANEMHGRGPSREAARSKNDPYLAFEIASDDGFSCRADSMDEAWRQVAEKVQDARVAARMKQLSFQSMSGVTMFGVSHNSLRYLIEQLRGVQHFRNYETLYHHYDLSPEEEEPAENPTGCIRTEGYNGRKPFDMFSFLMSMYRRRPDPVHAGKSDVEMNLKSQRRATSMDLPMAMRFRKLKEHSREAVGVYRSAIHGRGLFCKRNIDGGEMIIEYAGEVIRSSLTDKREKYYESKGIGCYMFRIDDVDVVDATMRGSAARFINHSCEPNCYSKVIQVDGKKHIVIFASRAIKRSEELTYDYKFPIEEVKIPCTCGQKRCRKYLN